MNDIKTALIQAMELYFGNDSKRIDHSHQVTTFAEKLLESEVGDYQIVIGASVLHDIGIHEAERKYGSTNGKYQEIEGPPIARVILKELGFELNQIEEICEIVAHHHSPGKITTTNFGILYDADWLVNLRDEYDVQNHDKLAHVIEKVFLTKTGKLLAKEIYLQKGE